MTNVQTRNTDVISISMPPQTLKRLDRIRLKLGQTRSSLITSLVNHYSLEQKWQLLRKWGTHTAKKLKITSEDDIDQLLHTK